MAQSSVVSTNFCFRVSKISSLTTIWSPECVIHGIPWKVKVSKNIIRGNESLGVYLRCEKNDNTSNWSHAALASFKPRSFVDDANAVKYHLQPQIFDNSGLGFGTDSLIAWKDLFDVQKGFVKNDAITFDIKIKAADPNDAKKSNLICAIVEKSCEEGCVATFRLTVNNIDNLMAVRTNQLILRNFVWYLTVYKHNSSFLGIRLENLRSADECSCDVRMSIKLISSTEAKKIKRVKTANVKRLGIMEVSNLVSWVELLKPKNGYVDDGSIIIEVELKVTNIVGHDQNNGNHIAAKNEEKLLKVECAICFEGVVNKELASVLCGHTFCTVCITEALEARKMCPMCGTPAKLEDLRRIYLNT